MHTTQNINKERSLFFVAEASLVKKTPYIAREKQTRFLQRAVRAKIQNALAVPVRETAVISIDLARSGANIAATASERDPTKYLDAT